MKRVIAFIGLVALIFLFLWWNGLYRGEINYWTPYPLGYKGSPCERWGIAYRPFFP
jgi:hypothetical protein